MSAPTADSLEVLVDTSLDDAFATARAQATAGTPVIGYVGADVPVELIDAAGAFPLALSGHAAAGADQADRYLESSFTPAIRAVAEQWLTGALDFLDAIVLPRSDDSAQRLYYYLCELERREPRGRGPRPLLYDLAKIPRPASRDHTRNETRVLAQTLGTDLERLKPAIESRDRRRALLARLDHLRRGATPPSGVLMARLVRALDTADAARFDAALAVWLEGLPAVSASQWPGTRRSRPGDRSPGATDARVLLAGSLPPDERLHRAVESAGGCVVAEQGEQSLQRLGRPIEPADGADLLTALADHYHALDFGARAFTSAGCELAHRIRGHHVDAVIVWLVEEDEAPVWDLPAQRRVCAEAGVPLLALTRRAWDAGDGALDEIAGFVSGVGTW